MSNFKLTIRDNSIGVLKWNQENSSANILSIEQLNEFQSVLSDIEGKNLKVLIFMSEKPSVFIAGADVHEIQKLKTQEEYRKVLTQAHRIFNRFASLNCSKIAVINGACFGGGMELALTFDYLLAGDSPQTRLGLPEVKLGVIPGFGGCIRLPRRVGLVQGLNMILKGELVSSKVALRRGLVDECVPSVILEQRAFELAEEVIKGRKPAHPLKKFQAKKGKDKLTESFLFRPLVFYLSKKNLLKQTKGFYPAPLAALNVIKKTYGSSYQEKSLEEEKEAFCRVAVTSESKNLIRLFLLMNKVKKPLSQSQLKLKNSYQVGVLGAGVMGGGIAYAFADKGHKVRIKDIQSSSLSQALTQANSLWEKQHSRRKIDAFEWKKRSENISASLNYSGFSNLDLVIEAIVEDENIKRKVIEETSRHLNSSAVFASNTSSLSIKTLSSFYPWPERFVGMHFFNPVYKMPLVEIIRTEKSENSAVELVFELAKQMGKTPVIVKDSPGFVVNRLLMSYLSEALWFLVEGMNIEEVDHQYTHKFGFPMGPFRLMDEVGLDVCLKVIDVFVKAGLNVSVPEEAKQFATLLGLGRKKGQGFYVYKKEGIKINEKIKSFQKTIRSADMCVERGVFRLINEGYQLLEEEVVQSKEDLDLAMVLGTGFPPFLGGPMKYAEKLGEAFIRKRLKSFVSRFGKRFIAHKSLS